MSFGLEPELRLFQTVSVTKRGSMAYEVIERIRSGGERRKFSDWESNGRGCEISSGKISVDGGVAIPVTLKLGVVEGLLLHPVEKTPRFFPLKLKKGEEAWILEVGNDLTDVAVYHAATQIIAHAAYRGFPEPNSEIFSATYLRRMRRNKRDGIIVPEERPPYCLDR